MGIDNIFDSIPSAFSLFENPLRFSSRIDDKRLIGYFARNEIGKKAILPTSICFTNIWTSFKVNLILFSAVYQIF
jgi:hypothetical protein